MLIDELEKLGSVEIAYGNDGAPCYQMESNGYNLSRRSTTRRHTGTGRRCTLRSLGQMHSGPKNMTCLGITMT